MCTVRDFVLTSLAATLLCVLPGSVKAQGTAKYEGARIVATYNTIISSEAPGIVKEIGTQAGELVAANDVLVRLNSDIYQAEFEVAAAEEEIAKLQATNQVNLEYAQKSAEVTEKTLAKSMNANRQFAKTISSTEIERLQLQLEQARLSGEQAAMEFDVAQWTATLRARSKQAAQVKLDNRVIRSPFSGTIAQIYIQPGQWINAGEPIARVIDLGNLRVEGYFNKDLVRRMKVGSSGSFQYTIGDVVTQVPVKVTFVSPEVVEGIFQVWAEIDNSERIHIPGLQGTLSLEIDD